MPEYAPIDIDFRKNITTTALEYQLAAPSPDSPFTAFADDAARNIGCSMDHVHWQLLMPSPLSFVRELEMLIASDAWPPGWTEELQLLWYELAIAECTEFCVFRTLENDLPVPCGPALLALVENLLADYSVSQAFQLFEAGLADTLDLIERKYVSIQRAEQFFIGACQRRADSARSEGLLIKGAQRHHIVRRTQASYLLHDVFLRHGEDGFFRVIPRL